MNRFLTIIQAALVLPWLFFSVVTIISMASRVGERSNGTPFATGNLQLMVVAWIIATMTMLIAVWLLQRAKTETHGH